MRVLPLFFMIASAMAQIERPGLGLMLDQDGAARPVYGVAGSATLGDAVANGALAVACSKRMCLVKTESSVIGPKGENVDAPPGPALIAPPFIYFSDSRKLARWQDGKLNPIDFAADGQVLALRAAEGGAVEFAVARDNGVWLVRGDGAVIDSLPAGLVMLVQRGAIFADSGGVVLQRTDGTEVRFDIANAGSFFPLGDGCVGIRAGASAWAVRIEPGREQAFLLPGAAE
jgi:hypothetical protein